MEAVNNLWIIFSLSFAAALSGAVSPGPFLVYTITKSIQNHKSGYMTGFLVVLGHAVLELGIMLFILFGLSFILKDKMVIGIISLLGCGFLVFFGITLIIDVLRKKINTDFLDKANVQSLVQKENSKRNALDNPILGGVIVSMSNPYWWIWWASIGAVFMARYNIIPSDFPRTAAFYSGHEMGDLIWYAPVSIAAYFGRSKLNKKIYSFILIICGVFMALFGLYLAVDPFLKK